jgi:hypothetical protein
VAQRGLRGASLPTVCWLDEPEQLGTDWQEPGQTGASTTSAAPAADSMQIQDWLDKRSGFSQRAEYLGADHRGRIRRRWPLSGFEHRVAATDLAARYRAGSGRMRRAAPPTLLAVMTAPRLYPADHQRRVGALENFDAYAIGTVKGDGL